MLLVRYASTLISDKDEHIDFEDVMQAIMCLMMAAFGLGHALDGLGDTKLVRTSNTTAAVYAVLCLI